MAIPSIVLQLDQPGQPDLLVNLGDTEVYQFTYTEQATGDLVDFTGLSSTWDIRDLAGVVLLQGSAFTGDGFVNVSISAIDTATLTAPADAVPGIPWALGVFRLRVTDGTEVKTLEEYAISGMT